MCRGLLPGATAPPVPAGLNQTGAVLNPLDDFPVHQTPEPVAHPATSDRNHYDRYFFNGYDVEDGVYFAAALGLYPNRQVMDAAFSVVVDGVQTSIHASRRAPEQRTALDVSPVRVQVDVPLHQLRVIIEPNESAVTGELLFSARTVASEEPRFVQRGPGNRLVFDYTRLTQFGSWSGWLDMDGTRIEVRDWMGSRDRSWGIRPVGERTPEPPGPLPQFFWLWAPVNFTDECTHFDVQEDGNGRRWHHNGVRLPVAPAGSSAWFDPSGPGGEPMASVDWSIRWRPGTRRADAAEITLRAAGGAVTVVALEPVLDFQMLGLGYLHPTWGHGVWQGEHAVEIERWRPADLDPILPQHLHVQQLCRATAGERTGVGILEILAIGPHAPSGFRELLDPAP
ncbi:MAG: hypothetical protein NVS1B12_01300 [Acidimicrobiales bacterium]